MRERVEAEFVYSTTGVSKLGEAKAAADALGKANAAVGAGTDKVAAAAGRLAASHAISGERMAKYGTTIGVLSGSMRELGVQNDLVARGIGVATEAFTGMMGPIGIVTVAIGGLATVIARAATESGRLRKETKSAVEGLGGYRGLMGTEFESNPAIKALFQQRTSDIEGELTSKRSRLDEVMGRLARSRDAGVWGENEKSLAGLRAEAGRLVKEIIDLNLQLEQTRTDVAALNGVPILPEIVVKPPLGSGGPISNLTSTDALTRGMRLEPIELPVKLIPEQPIMDSGRLMTSRPFNAAETFRMGTGGSQMSDEDRRAEAFLKAEEMVTKAAADHAARRQKIAEAEARRRDALIARYPKTYAGAMGAVQGMQEVSSRIVQAALLREDVSRLKGLEVVKYVAASGLKAVADELAKKASIKAAEQIAEALSSWPNPTAMAAHFAAAAAWGALGGTASGIGAAVMGGAQRDLDRGLRQAEEYGGGGVGGTSSSGGARGNVGPSASIVDAGAVSQTINYNIQVTYASAVVYGQGGTRDWFYRELVPLYKEARMAGLIA